MRTVKRKEVAIIEQTQSGFTIIEVMLVLAITGLMLVGLIAGSFSSIARQRYNDAVRGFADYMSGTYNSVIRPESVGNGGTNNSLGNSTTHAILGKVLVFGHDYGNSDDNRSVYSATLVGDTNILRSSQQDFRTELANEAQKTNFGLVCGAIDAATGNVVEASSVQSYLPLWESYLTTTNGGHDEFQGIMIIARTPTSAVVHTAFLDVAPTFNLKDECTPDAPQASGAFRDFIRDHASQFDLDHNTTICVKSDDVSFARAIQIDADGRNSAAVKILSETESNSGDIRCH